MSKRFGFKEVSDDDEWTLYWTDYSVALERVMEMKKYQVIGSEKCMNEMGSHSCHILSFHTSLLKVKHDLRGGF